jgi:hypothetical protein
MYEKRLIEKALYSINGCVTQGVALDLDLPGSHSIVGVSPSFTVQHFPTTKRCLFRWLGSNKSVRVHPTVLLFLGKQWETLVGGSTSTLECYTEFLHKDGVIFQAHPNYWDEGPWYDWAMV